MEGGGDYYYEGKATKESVIIKIIVIILKEKSLNNFDYYTFFVDFHVMYIVEVQRVYSKIRDLCYQS